MGSRKWQRIGGADLEIRILVDSNAAIGIANRRGNGKMRHVKVGDLWIQEKVEEKELRIEKVAGEDNPADLMTKNVGQELIKRHMGSLSQEFRTGRAERSLQL